MKLKVNGKDIEFDKRTVLHLIEQYSLKPGAVVVEKNGEIVKRQMYETEALADGDVVEIVRFVGGG